jgi:hypothetical protein
MFFGCAALVRVLRTMKVNIPMSNNAMKTNFVMLELISGHLAHLAVPVKEYPGLHSAQSTPA